MPTTEATLEAIRSMPVNQRLEVLFRAWDQLVDEGWQPEMPPALEAELERRWADHLANPDAALTWDEILEYVRRPR